MAAGDGERKSEARAVARNARRWADASLALILLPTAVSVLLIARWGMGEALVLPGLAIPGVVCAHVALRRLRRKSGIQLAVRAVAVLGYVVGVLWLLFGVDGFVTWVQFPRERFKREMRGCHMRLSVLGSAVELYAANHEGRMPPGKTALEVLSVVLKEGDTGSDLFLGGGDPGYVCPGDDGAVEAWREEQELSEETCSYALVAGVGVDSPKDFIMLYDKRVENHRIRGGWWIRNRPRGRNVCATTGEDYFAVVWLDEEEFQERMEWQREMMERMRQGEKYVPFEGWERNVRPEEEQGDG